MLSIELRIINLNEKIEWSKHLKELTKKQFMQGKKKMTIAYRITVKNNRNRAIDFELLGEAKEEELSSEEELNKEEWKKKPIKEERISEMRPEEITL